MRKNANLYFIIGGLVLLFALFYWYSQKNNRRGYDWSDRSGRAYSEAYTEPYGSTVLRRLLDGYFPGQTVTDLKKEPRESLPLDTTGSANYVFIGEAMFLDSLSTARLLEFVAAGNTALISSKTIPFDLMFHLTLRTCEDAEWNDYLWIADSSARLSLTYPDSAPAPAVPFVYARKNEPAPYDWHHFPADHFCDSVPQRPIGHLNDSLVNFAAYPHGHGWFYLHTTPLAFSNYSLLRRETRPYAEQVLSVLREGPIYWDAVSRVPEDVGRRRNGNQPRRRFDDEHALAFILQQPALAWAWYLLLGMAAAYLLFRAKRRQRVIPVLAKNENSSYEFINTIAHLHFRERNYQGLCVQDMRLFLAHLRERYGLAAAVDPDTLQVKTDSDFRARLAHTAEVPETVIKEIFETYSHCVNYQPTEQMMIDLHLAIERFMQKAK